MYSGIRSRQRSKVRTVATRRATAAISTIASQTVALRRSPSDSNRSARKSASPPATKIGLTRGSGLSQEIGPLLTTRIGQAMASKT